MAGVLQFTLGLEVSNFLRGIGLASGQIVGFSGAMTGLSKAMAATWAAIERGGALTDLANRTGESVGTLYQLQSAFQSVGLSADTVSPMLLRMQKSLSGVDEMGNKTDDVFKALGLNMEKLRSMDAPKQFEILSTAISGLSKESGVDISSRIFGREGAGNFMQITRDAKEFQQTLRDTVKEAALVQRTAAAFDQIGDTVTTLKRKFDVLWVGVAEGAAPAIQSMLDWLNSFDFQGFGERIGSALNSAFAMIKSGEVYQLLGLGFQAASELLGNSLRAVMVASADSLTQLLSGAFRGIAEVFRSIWQNLAEWAGHTFMASLLEKLVNIADIGAVLGIPGFQGAADDLESAAVDQRSAASDAWENMDREAIGRGLEMTFKGVGDTFVKTLTQTFGAGSTAAQEALKAALEKASLNFQTKSQAGAATADTGRNITLPSGKDRSKTDLSDWEKIGMVFRTGGGASDSAAETAKNTALTYRAIELNNKLLSKFLGVGGGTSFENV